MIYLLHSRATKRQNNRSMTIQDAAIRQRVEEIVRSILEDV